MHRLYALILGLLLVPHPTLAEAPDATALYRSHCLSCHQADGYGVPDMQPPLVGSDLLAGPPATLIDLVLYGKDDPDGRWLNPMGGFSFLSDAEIAALLTDLRLRFAEAGPVSPDAVAAQRQTR